MFSHPFQVKAYEAAAPALRLCLTCRARSSFAIMPPVSWPRSARSSNISAVFGACCLRP